MFNMAGKSTVLHYFFVRILLLLSLAGILVACGGNGTANISPAPTTHSSIPKITITARDFAFAMSDQLQIGFVDITLANQGAEEHQAQFARLNDGVTLDQLKAALKKGPEAALPLVAPAGGINSVKPGESQEVILDLAEGEYIVLDLIAGKDNIPHTEKGMIQAFKVTGASNHGQVKPSQADVQVTLKDFSFELPSTLKSGLLTYKVTNQGPQPHEVVLLKLAPGKTLQDVQAALHSESAPPGASAWHKMNLAPGNYVALCFIPDKASGMQHAQKGMVVEFTVQ
jgi:hypothetical protein